ncbi:hypothetical protein ACOWMK_00135 [Helicobacter pylori]|nr:hypothetical protein KVL56_00975 [Helicobacter pylori]
MLNKTSVWWDCYKNKYKDQKIKQAKNIQAILQAKEHYLNRFFKISYNQGFKNNPKKEFEHARKID